MSSANIVYIVDPDQAMGAGLTALLGTYNIPVEYYADVSHFLESTQSRNTASGCLFIALDFPGASAMDLLHQFSAEDNHLPIIMVGRNITADLRHEATAGTIAFDVALPTGWVPNDVDPAQQSAMRLAFATSAATHGNRRLWLWAPERLSLVLRGTVSHRFAEAFDVFGEAGVAPMIPVGDEGTDTDLFMEGTVGGAWVVPDLLRLGLGLSLAWLPTGTGDVLQTSLQLFGRVWLDNLFLALAFTMNLDEPAGFAFDNGGIWGLHFGVGSQF